MTTNVVPLKSGGQIAGIIPQSVDEVFRLAEGIAKSGLAPKDLNTPDKITVAILTGLELGLPPMFSLNKIAIINGRPTLWGDALPGLLWARGFKLKEWLDGDIAHCEVTRPDGEKITRTFSLADAKKANLLGKPGPWQQYQSRMLAMRARGFACRDGAADVLGGLYLREEIEDEPMRDITPAEDAPKRKSSSAAKKDGTAEIFNEIRKAIADAQNSEFLEQVRTLYEDEWDVMPKRWCEILDNEYEDRMASFQVREAPAAE